MQQSTNYNMNKPDLTDQYRLSHWNENTDIIDEELKKREEDDTALKNPVYTEASAEAPLVSGELFTTAFGKIAKAVSSFITHKGSTTSVHGSTSDATASKIIERDANARAKVADAIQIKDIPNYQQLLYESLYKQYYAVTVVATTNLTLYGEQVVDGVNVLVGSSVLCIAQTDATQNGVYSVQTGAWTRWQYGSVSNLNRRYLCILSGTKKGKIYKTETDSYTEGTTVLTYRESNELINGNWAKYFWRKKINACEEFRPPIGIPFFWMADKPDWAIDFGNGASTKYLWTTYPELNNDMFKSILTKHYNAGSCQNYDNEGFYVPDLRGLVPIGYGTNAVRTAFTLNGGSSPGAFSESQNRYHRHDKGDYRITGWLSHWRLNSTGYNGERSNGALQMYQDSYYSVANNVIGSDFSGSWSIYFDTNLNGGAGFVGNSGWSHTDSKRTAKPATFAGMWIVRFE